jgi:hypothetical protein
MSGRVRRGHPNGRVIAVIWIVLLVLAFVAAIVFQDDDPTTDEGAGAGALVGIVGSILTGLYVGSSYVVKAVREHRSSEARIELPTVTRRGVRRAVLVAAASLVALTALGFALQGFERLRAHGEAETEDPAVLVLSAVRAASPTSRIESVDCTDERVSGVFNCAITFEGPACQVWMIGEDGQPIPTEEPLAGMRGSATDTGASCAV